MRFPGSSGQWMRGRCWEMAVALHQRTGFPIHGLFDEKGVCHHAFVIDRDGAGIDARGRLSIAAIKIGCAGQIVRPLSESDIEHWVGRPLHDEEIRDAYRWVWSHLEHL